MPKAGELVDDDTSWPLAATADSKWEAVIIGRVLQVGLGPRASDTEEVLECPPWPSGEADEGNICWSSSNRVK